MAIVPAWMVDPKKIEAAIGRAEAALKPNVVHIRYSVEDDWSGDPAICFRVLLSDRDWSAIRETPEAQDFLLSLLVKKR